MIAADQKLVLALTITLPVISNLNVRGYGEAPRDEAEYERILSTRSLEEPTLMRVAFSGLGIMGRWMATNLVKAGHEVAVWNRSEAKDVEGPRTASSPR